VDRYLDVLEDSFGAAAAASEEEAADDLALSFLQDLNLADALERLGPYRCCPRGGTPQPILEVGADYVVIDSGHPSIVPLAAALYRAHPGAPVPRIAPRTMIELLRHLVRQGVDVVVDHGAGHATGTLKRAGRDHVALDVRGAEMLIPLGGVMSIALGEEQVWRF
jgi:hypothetical protein